MAHSVEPRYVLSGTVTSAANGEPIANAEVALTAGNPSYVVDQMSTNTEGAYRFDIVHPGLYGVMVTSAPGHLPEVLGGFICPLDGCNGGDSQAVELSDDRPHASEIDFTLEPPAVLAGAVKDAATGHGIAGAEIIVAIEYQYRSSHTDSGGEYSLDLPPGDAWVVAADGGYQDQIYPGQPCGQSTFGTPDCDRALGTAVPLATGQTSSGIDFALERGASIIGRVVEEPSGAPIEGTWVEVWDDERLAKRALTGGDGFYIVGGLPSGVFHVLTSTLEGPHLDELYGGRFCFRFGLRLYCDRTLGETVAIAAGQAVTGIDFGLSRGSLIAGRVSDAASGDALSQWIEIYDEQGRLASYALSGDSGSYASRGLPAGTYLALARTSDFSKDQAGEAHDGRVCHPHCEAADVLAGGDWTPIVLTDDADRIDIDFDLLRPASIAGRISDAVTGQGIAGAQVHIHSTTSISGGHAHADEDGSYEIGGLWNESYSVRVQADGYLDFIYPGVVTGGLFDEVRATIGERVSGIDIAMAGGGAIKARVTLPGSAAGLDALATVFDLDGNAVLEKAISQDDGILAPLPPGEYFVQIERGGVTVTYPDIVCATDCDPTAGTPVVVEDVRFTNIFFSFPDDILASCVPSPTTLCLQGGRFSAGIEFRQADGSLASARVEELTAETGYFWFFGPDNIEVVLKVLDACAPPFDRFWVFAAGLTNVEVLLTVTDTAIGAERIYTNVAGTAFEPILDTDAFNTCGASSSPPGAGSVTELAASLQSPRAEIAAAAASTGARPVKSPCAAGTLCLQDERFEVTATWATDTTSGTARGVPLTSDSGYFWFFDADNVEIVLKVLDACAPPYERFWVFTAGLTNVEVELRVRDTVSEEVRTYLNPAGSAFQPVLDTQAFATCAGEGPS